MDVQWYPGHMAKAKRLLSESLKSVDAVCEIVDARIPRASRNPDIDALSAGKPRMIILNRADQADASMTSAWALHYKSEGFTALETDAKSGDGVSRFSDCLRSMLLEKLRRYEQKGMGGRMPRVMVTGIPNVGKSSFINRVIGRRSAKTEDRPGVTRQNQWFVLEGGIQLLDTPGILPPKIESRRAGMLLAYTGAVKDSILDIETLACGLMHELSLCAPQALAERYKLKPELIEADAPDEEQTAGASPEILHGYELLSAAARGRGFLISGGEINLERMAHTLLDEFRGGKLGRITLERPPSQESENNP